MTTNIELPISIRETAVSALRLASLLSAAHAVQWSPSHRAKPREDTTERAKGGHGDPTGDAVLDDRRLALREAVIAAERALYTTKATLDRNVEALQTALENWEGANPGSATER